MSPKHVCFSFSLLASLYFSLPEPEEQRPIILIVVLFAFILHDIWMLKNPHTYIHASFSNFGDLVKTGTKPAWTENLSQMNESWQLSVLPETLGRGLSIRLMFPIYASGYLTV